jgi:CDP-glucose 4,6-dehydratase
MNGSFWKGMRIFVTGATGLLGSHLTRKLLSFDACVTVLLRDQGADSLLVQSPEWPRVTKIFGELQSFEKLARVLNEYETEYVMHLGAQTQVTHANRQPLETFESNIRGTYNLLEASRQHPHLKGLMVASSDKAYGSQPILPYTEDTPLQGKYPYDASKSCADLLAQTYHNTYDLPVCITRCGNLYGPGDLNFLRIIPDAIRSVHEARPLRLRSDGTFGRDYLFVEDAVDGYLTIAQRIGEDGITGQSFNLSTGSKLRVLDVVDMVGKVMGVNVPVEVLDEANGEIRDQYLSSDKAKRLLGWEPKHTFEEGLAKTVPAYQRYLATGRWEDRGDDDSLVGGGT